MRKGVLRVIRHRALEDMMAQGRKPFDLRKIPLGACLHI